ncbi:M56 family metallopeptidase [Mariniblastus fucicola]|uniref:Regulatory protein BlaR1 n=1 Tax=Mariniblastus fucicola TaxID=980251 RepID=A0A5B9P357_9BACT|nr:M56 family metallopeptidase [Mariniblastus fucicola]QEG20604.1 Regulatory protein BlaR1 [Mariniblastus fucicola]
MSLSITALLLATGFASIAIALFALFAAQLLTSLPLRHETLRVGLVLSLLVPIPFVVGNVLDIGLLPNAIPASTELSEAKPVDVPAPAGYSDSTFEFTDTNFAIPGFEQSRMEPGTDDLRSSTVSVPRAAVVKPLHQPEYFVPTWPQLLIGVWLFGTVLCIGRYLWKAFQLRKLTSNFTLPVETNLLEEVETIANRLGLRRVPGLICCPAVKSPVIVGLRSPSLLVPENFSKVFDEESRRQILTHELAHVKRRDHWTLLVQSMAHCIYWWNPLVRVISRKLAVTREMLCDDIAVKLEGRWRKYAETMLLMAEQAVDNQPGSLSLAMAAGDLESRLSRVLELEGRVPGTRIRPLLAATIAIPFLLLFSSFAFAQFASPTLQETGNAESIVAKTETTKAEPTKNESTTYGSAENAMAEVSGVTAPDPVVVVDPSNDIPEFNPRKVPSRKYKVRFIDASSNPLPNAKAEFHEGRLAAGKFTADEKGEAKFIVGDTFQQRYSALKVTSPDGKLGAIFAMNEVVRDKPESFEVKLVPLAERTVKVIDNSRGSIANATIAIGFGRPIFGFQIMGNTDKEGMYSFRAPVESSISNVFAYKEGYGVDYLSCEKPDDRRNQPNVLPKPFLANETRTLILEPPAPFVTLVVDENGEPVEDAIVRPWLLENGEQAQFNLSLVNDLIQRKTDASGRATIDWFPRWQKAPVTISPSKANHDRSNGTWEPGQSEVRITMEKIKMTRISGVLLDQAGNPVPGCQVRCDGREYYEGVNGCFTDEEGKFWFNAKAGGELVIFVGEDGFYFSDKRRVSDFVRVTVPEPDQPVDDLVVRLVDPVPVTVRMVNEASGKLVASHRSAMFRNAMTGEQYRQNCELDPDWRFDSVRHRRDGPWRNVPTISFIPSIQKHEGELKGWLAPGIYTLRPNDRDYYGTSFVVDREPVTIEIPTKTGAVSTLKGWVRVDGVPVENAEIVMTSKKFHGDRWTATSNEDGSYEVQMRENESLLVCFSSDRKHAVGLVADMFGKRFDLNLKRVCEIRGKLVGQNDQGLGNRRVYFGTEIYAASYVGFVMTDDDGTFVIKEVCPGLKLDIFIYERSGQRKFLAKLPTLTSGEKRDVGIVRQ